MSVGRTVQKSWCRETSIAHRRLECLGCGKSVGGEWRLQSLRLPPHTQLRFISMQTHTSQPLQRIGWKAVPPSPPHLSASPVHWPCNRSRR